jgi:hypothetical protein
VATIREVIEEALSLDGRSEYLRYAGRAIEMLEEREVRIVNSLVEFAEKAGLDYSETMTAFREAGLMVPAAAWSSSPPIDLDARRETDSQIADALDSIQQGFVSLSTALRQGSITVLHPDLGFEIRTANNTRTGIRTCDLYLRWNPNRVHDTAAVLRTARQIKEEA